MRALTWVAWVVALGSPALAQRTALSAPPTEHVTRDLTPRRAQAIGNGQGFFTGDLLPADYFGWFVSALGDLDGNGTPDIVVLEPGNEPSLWILFLQSSGFVIGERELAIGGSVSGLGDVDGDGIPDLAVGRPGTPGQPGTVTLLFLNRDGTVREQAQIDGTVGATGVSAGGFGAGVAGPGDVDGDGVPDLAVGTYFEVWVVLLNADGTVKARRDFSPGLGGFPDVSVHEFGLALDGLGDFDEDGVPDLILGAQESLFEGRMGHVWLALLNADGTLKSTISVRSSVAGIWPIQNDCAVFYEDGGYGIAVTAPGDLDGDGITDIAVGAPWGPMCCAGSGSTWILKLRADGSVRGKHEITAGSPPFDLPLEPLDLFGFSVASPGDIDGDGRPDLVVGTPGSLGTLPDTYDLECGYYNEDPVGRVWLLFGPP